jgi:hypothetical protein
VINNTIASIFSAEKIKVMKIYLTRIAGLCDCDDVNSWWEYLLTYVETVSESNTMKFETAKTVLEGIRGKEQYWCRAWFKTARNFGEKTTGREKEKTCITSWIQRFIVKPLWLFLQGLIFKEPREETVKNWPQL